MPSKGKNRKVIGLMKDGSGGNLKGEFVALRLKTYGYLVDDNDEDKKAKGTGRHCLEATHLENKIKQLEKNKLHVDSPQENYKKFIKKS